MTPTVSIVIPTWQRHTLLKETLENISNQTFLDKEVIIVCDGQDQYLHDYYSFRPSYWDYKFSVRFVELGRNWSGLMPQSFGIAPLLVGYLMAKGKYIMPWCDDERALTDYHIEKLVYLIEKENVDFVYPKVHVWRNGNPYNEENKVIGVHPPEQNQITHYLFKATTLYELGLPRWNTHPVDWSLVEDWLSNGARCAMLDEETFSHRLDQ